MCHFYTKRPPKKCIYIFRILLFSAPKIQLVAEFMLFALGYLPAIVTERTSRL